jgi:hypothetical protein
LEIYSSGRYFTFTGARTRDTAIRPIADVVDALIAEAKGAQNAATFAPATQTIQSDHWFANLTPEHKDQAVQYILGELIANTKILELSDNGGNNDDYFKLITALAVSGAPHAEDYFVEAASKVDGADSEDLLREKFKICAKNADGRITTGTLLYLAQTAGIDLSPQTRADKGWTANGSDAVTIDWAKVRSDWTIADLPADAPLTAKITLAHVGTVRDLSSDLKAQKLISTGLTSWSAVTKILVDSLLRAKYSLEQIAEILSAKLTCNRSIHDQPDLHKAIEKAIERVQEAATAKSADGNWPEGTDDAGRPRKGLLNTMEALARLGITDTWDMFRRREYWYGHEDRLFDGEVADAAIDVTMRNIAAKYRFTPHVEELRRAARVAAYDNRSNPVLDYYKREPWDNVPRLPTMFPVYFGADDTPLYAAYAIKFMCAIIWRTVEPGYKFDHQLDLAGPQEIKKSMACRDIAVFPDLYTDAGDFTLDDKRLMEIGEGMQVVEFPENTGREKTARSQIKKQITAQSERARAAYAHYATDIPRTWVRIATMNDYRMLDDPTGERRDWVVHIKHFDRDAFLRDK